MISLHRTGDETISKPNQLTVRNTSKKEQVFINTANRYTESENVFVNSRSWHTFNIPFLCSLWDPFWCILGFIISTPHVAFPHQPLSQVTTLLNTLLPNQPPSSCVQCCILIYLKFSLLDKSFNLKKLNLSIFPSRHFPFPQYFFFLINVAFLAQPHKLLITADFDFPQGLWSNQVTSHITLLDTNSSSSSSSYNPSVPTKKQFPPNLLANTIITLVTLILTITMKIPNPDCTEYWSASVPGNLKLDTGAAGEGGKRTDSV